MHELGHYLGLGEPYFDERYDQIDSVMSYNKSNQIEGGYRTWFASADIDILLEYFGPEDDGDVNVKEGDVNSNSVIGSTTTHDFLVGYGGNDYCKQIEAEIAFRWPAMMLRLAMDVMLLMVVMGWMIFMAALASILLKKHLTERLIHFSK